MLPYDPRRDQNHVVALQADLWAVGVTLFQLLTGHLPFAGSNSSDLLVVRKAILGGEVMYPEYTPPLLQCFLEVQTHLPLLIVTVFNHFYPQS